MFERIVKIIYLRIYVRISAIGFDTFSKSMLAIYIILRTNVNFVLLQSQGEYKIFLPC